MNYLYLHLTCIYSCLGANFSLNPLTNASKLGFLNATFHIPLKAPSGASGAHSLSEVTTVHPSADLSNPIPSLNGLT